MKRRSVGMGLLMLLLATSQLSCPYAPGPSEPALGALVALEVVAEGLERPLFLTSAPADDSRLFVVEQAGIIRLIDDGTLLTTPFLDIRALVGSLAGERGLLGLALHPDFASNRQFFVNYTNTQGDNVLARYETRGDNPNQADPNSAQVLWTLAQPYSTHNSGMIAFGPDGYLYIGSGDGGSANDPENNGQSLDTLLGKILRIDVNNGSPYAIPPDNPFVGMTEARPEIWAYGVRNPWRFSFDRETGDLWIGDVGQFAFEEINFQAASSGGGENYGWRIREGSICGTAAMNCELADRVEPFHEYFNLGSQSITGGYVYRGAALPGLTGIYWFGDYITGAIYALRRNADDSITVSEEREAILRGAPGPANMASFGEDANGELYVVDYGGGTVFKMIAAS